MAFIHTLPASEAGDDVRAMYARQQSHYGYVPNYAKAFCHHPELMQHWAQLQASIKRRMDKRRFELVTFAAATALRSTLCSLAHGKMLAELIPQRDVLAIARGDRATSLSAAECEMVAFARKVARDASVITNEDVGALRRQGYTDAEVFDIASTAAARAFWTKLLDAVGVDADAAFASLGDDFRNTLTVGRPPSFVEPERLVERAGTTA